jgi:hypothetical protein
LGVKAAVEPKNVIMVAMVVSGCELTLKLFKYPEIV